MDPRKISIQDYSYTLPENRIALYPEEKRDSSRLLIWKEGRIAEDRFQKIPFLLPPDSLIIFNNTRVVEARIIFQKPTGARIEILCLEPGDQYPDIATALGTTGSVIWKCMVGNASSWNKELILEKRIGGHSFRAQMISKENADFLIRFSWTPEEISFAEILHEAGLIPLPPYIKRKTEVSDSERYQTIYADHSGSVAAPTAGLHFTQNILKELGEKNIHKDFVTLHVGAGTFKPVKTETMNEHEMHAEFIEVKRPLIENIYNNIDQSIIAVGTTSLRTLESIYWIGVKILSNNTIPSEELTIQQWDPYTNDEKIPAKKAVEALLKWMSDNSLEVLITKTSLLIAPPYEFKIVKILITNFHQPRSTLLLLVAAFVGENWKRIYEYALENDFRFLSYGDACLFFRN